VHEIDWGLLMIRVMVGLVIFMHGYNHFFGGGRIPGAGRWFQSMGLRPGLVHAWVTAVLEVTAGPAYAAGLFTPLSGAAIVGMMAVAGMVVHRPNGFFIFREGYEYVLTVAVVVGAVGVIGPGRGSLDHALFGWTDVTGWGGLGLSLGLGLAGAAALLAACWRPPPKPAA